MAPLLAFVLVTTEAGKTYAVLDEIADLDRTTNAYVVTGAYDIIAQIEADTLDELVTDTVIERIRAIRGVTQTTTCIIVRGKAGRAPQRKPLTP